MIVQVQALAGNQNWQNHSLCSLVCLCFLHDDVVFFRKVFPGEAEVKDACIEHCARFMASLPDKQGSVCHVRQCQLQDRLLAARDAVRSTHVLCLQTHLTEQPCRS